MIFVSVVDVFSFLIFFHVAVECTKPLTPTDLDKAVFVVGGFVLGRKAEWEAADNAVRLNTSRKHSFFPLLCHEHTHTNKHTNTH
eukprot:m.101839 g.101839  ORF g.101839 m.101839 type:complete len:85 (-) comp15478_c0_seq4:52-306(-)